MTIPSGPLREDVNSIKKYEHIFLNGNLENLEDLKKKILKINSNVNIHVGEYEQLISMNLTKMKIIMAQVLVIIKHFSLC